MCQTRSAIARLGESNGGTERYARLTLLFLDCRSNVMLGL